MRRAAFALVVLLVAAATVLGFAYVLTEGGLFSRPSETWGIEVRAQGPGAWALAVPAIVAVEPGERADLLERLYEDLSVRRGEASFGRDGARLVLRGSMGVDLEAQRVGRPSAFGGWGASETRVTRLDAEGPPTTVTWRVDFSGGDGHTCWARATYTVMLGPGEEKEMAEPGSLNQPGRPWNTACA